VVAVDFVAQGEPVVSGEPGQGAFDFQRYRPRRSPVSIPRRAMRGVIAC